jgi:hypothetical protein
MPETGHTSAMNAAFNDAMDPAELGKSTPSPHLDLIRLDDG